jgi:hypothetical protein
MTIFQTHGQADTFARQIHFYHFDLDDVARRYHFVRVLDEGIGQRRNMHQAILMHADIDEGAEVGDVGDGAFKNHSRLEVLHILNAFLELGGLEFRSRVAARLFQFADNVFHRRHAEALAGVIGRIKFAQKADIANQILQRPAMFGGNALNHHIGFRVHAGAVERIFAAHDAQEAGGLFKSFVAQTRHLFQGITIG